ncbi:MAG: hypothetical protein WAL12_20950 [Trebonia sp.]
MTTNDATAAGTDPAAPAVSEGARQLYKVSTPDELRLLIEQGRLALSWSEPPTRPAVWLALADAYDETNMVLGVFASPDSARAACDEAHREDDSKRPALDWSQSEDGDWYAQHITPEGFAVQYSAQSWEVRP